MISRTKIVAGFTFFVARAPWKFLLLVYLFLVSFKVRKKKTPFYQSLSYLSHAKEEKVENWCFRLWLAGVAFSKTHRHVVKGSTTQKYKLKSLGIAPVIVRCSEDNRWTWPFFTTEVLILTYSGLRQNPKRRFDLVIEQIVKRLVDSAVQEVIFISSTRFMEMPVETYGKYPTCRKVKQLLLCEDMLLTCPSFKTTVLRFGRLIGPQRHPIYSCKTCFYRRPNGIINFIHLEDCLQCLSILEKQHQSGVFNACPTSLHERITTQPWRKWPVFNSAFVEKPRTKDASFPKFKTYSMLNSTWKTCWH